MDWLKDITIDDMPNEDMRMVAETCGLPVAVKLMKACGGTKLYVPRVGFKKLIDRKIVEEFRGCNVRKLSLKYGVSRTYVFNILQKHRKDRRRTSCSSEENGFSMQHSVPV